VSPTGGVGVGFGLAPVRASWTVGVARAEQLNREAVVGVAVLDALDALDALGA
jgi:hypothetical protein